MPLNQYLDMHAMIVINKIAHLREPIWFLIKGGHLCILLHLCPCNEKEVLPENLGPQIWHQQGPYNSHPQYAPSGCHIHIRGASAQVLLFASRFQVFPLLDMPWQFSLSSLTAVLIYEHLHTP